ncbi:hypothetical protein MAR_015770 [Mya arenaria]|uniref:Uncharacterized protein n=1 Tax=Mya arenaria TaxID=6604 RepID=A0ABY7FLJ2_MYAAR|nr:hypothetical protein MAR_015770 [Mya arenaria]
MPRMCEIALPEVLVERLEELPGGMRSVLTKIEREFGLHTAVSHVGGRKYTIVGPNPDILELAEERESVVSGEIEGKRAVWRLQGDYASKAAHLFKPELEAINKLPGVHLNVSPLKLEISAGYEQTEKVRGEVESLELQIDALHEHRMSIKGSHAEIVRLRQFIQRKNKYDYTVIFVPDERHQSVTVYGRTEETVKRIVDEWAIASRSHGASPNRMLSVSPSFSYSTVGSYPQWRAEMKIPAGIVSKLERQRCGVASISADIEREFGLKLAVQTLIHRYVLRTPPKHGVLGQLQGKNAVWKFNGNYAKKVAHLFAKELKRISRIQTVNIKATPSRLAPVCLSVLCSVRVIEIVKAEIEKVVGQLHNLFEMHLDVPDDAEQVSRVKTTVLWYADSADVLIVYDERSRRVTAWGRNELPVRHAIGDLQHERKLAVREEPSTAEFWNMYRELFQTKIPEEIVEKLEELPDGIMSLITKMQQEYVVRPLYHREHHHLVLVSPSVEVLELAQETLGERYAALYDEENKVDNHHHSIHKRSDFGHGHSIIGHTSGGQRFAMLNTHNANGDDTVEDVDNKGDVNDFKRSVTETKLLETIEEREKEHGREGYKLPDIVAKQDRTQNAVPDHHNNSVDTILNRHYLTKRLASMRAISKSPTRILSRSTTGSWSRGLKGTRSKVAMITSDRPGLRSSLKSSNSNSTDNSKSKKVSFVG